MRPAPPPPQQRRSRRRQRWRCRRARPADGRRMVDRVATAARGATLKTAKLSDEALVIEQFNAAAVQERQQVAIQIGFRLGGDGVFDAMNPETLAWPLRGETIAAHR